MSAAASAEKCDAFVFAFDMFDICICALWTDHGRVVLRAKTIANQCTHCVMKNGQ